MKLIFAVMVAALFLSGCAAPTEEMKNLRVQNDQLQSDLVDAQTYIRSLEREKTEMTEHVAQLNRISNVLEQEKSIRVEETGQLRQNVRTFVRNQLAGLRNFSKREDFFDYLGGELIDRAGSLAKAPALIDTRYTIPAGGTLYGVRGKFNNPATLRLVVLRPVKEQWVVIWNSEQIKVAHAGVQQIDFATPVSVETNDLIAYLFTDRVPVSCDQGTGGMIVVDRRLATGHKMTSIQVKEHLGWACSIGVIGMIGD